MTVPRMIQLVESHLNTFGLLPQTMLTLNVNPLTHTLFLYCYSSKFDTNSAIIYTNAYPNMGNFYSDTMTTNIVLWGYSDEFKMVLVQINNNPTI